MSKMSLCYVINGVEKVIHESDDMVKMIPCVAGTAGKELELSVEIINYSGQEVFLKYVTLWEVSCSAQLCVGEAPFEVYRSGRHKNDMPGTFTLGVSDGRMQDVLGAMSETGDKTEREGQQRQIVSDHLTVFQGSERSLVVVFPGGRKQLFQTEIGMDGDCQFQTARAKVLFNINLDAERSITSEQVRLTWTKDVEAEVERFALEKAKKYGRRCGKHPSVFCTWYYYGLTVTYEDVKTNLEIMRDRRLPFDVWRFV